MIFPALGKSNGRESHAATYQVRKDQEGCDDGGGDRGHRDPTAGRQRREEGARREARLAVEAEHGAPAAFRGTEWQLAIQRTLVLFSGHFTGGFQAQTWDAI